MLQNMGMREGKTRIMQLSRPSGARPPGRGLILFFAIGLLLLGALVLSHLTPDFKDGEILKVFEAGGARDTEPTVHTNFAMGTVITMKAYGPNGEAAIQRAFDRIRELEGLMSVNLPSSQISKLNRNAGEMPVKLDRAVFYVLEKAKEYAALTGGKFDPTIEPIVKLWGIGTEKARVPQNSEIESALRLVNYQDLILDPSSLTARLARPGMAVDLGGIAKGYAADEVAQIFKEAGIKSAYVDIGGNVLVVGTKPDGSPWRVAIQDPRSERGLYVAIISAQDEAIVTSGDYERYFERDGRRYHHIFDPATGWPSNSGIISATIVSKSSIDADALSTSVFILGPTKGMKLIESLPGIEGVIITKDFGVLVSPGLKDRISFKKRLHPYKEAHKEKRGPGIVP